LVEWQQPLNQQWPFGKWPALDLKRRLRRHCYCDSHADCNSNGDNKTDGDRDCNGDSNKESHGHTDSYCHCNRNEEPDCYAYGNKEPNRNSYGYRNGNSKRQQLCNTMVLPGILCGRQRCQLSRQQLHVHVCKHFQFSMDSYRSDYALVTQRPMYWFGIDAHAYSDGHAYCFAHSNRQEPDAYSNGNRNRNHSAYLERARACRLLA
jgi:hypothetical protein